MNELPLEEVVRQLRATSVDLGSLDMQISEYIKSLERWLVDRGVKRVKWVTVVEGVQLAWSGAKNRWRFVVRYEDQVIDLLSASREERAEAFTSGAMERLVEQLVS